MSKLPLYQLATGDAINGQFVGLVDGEWTPVDPPAGGGGEPGSGSGAFFDPFDRADTPLNGNNGWVNATNAPAGGDTVATFYVEGNLVKQTGFGGYPILHDRQSESTEVADVQCDVGFGVSGAVGHTQGICFAADPTCAHGFTFFFDGSDTYYTVERYEPDGRYGGSLTWTDHGWVAWGVGDPMKIRCVYTEATTTLDVYQNDVLALSADISDVGGGFGFTFEAPPLTVMTHAGLVSYQATHSHTFENFSIDQSDGTGGGGGGTGTGGAGGTLVSETEPPPEDRYDGMLWTNPTEEPLTGPDAGPSAYDIAVSNGFVGTEVEWLTSLQGAPGDPGATYDDTAVLAELADHETRIGALETGGGGGGGTDPDVTAELADHETRLDSLEAIPPGGAVIDVTDTPPDPPPYIGYAYLTSDGKFRIWNGTGWRQLSTLPYTSPAEGDAAIMLPSLVGRYRALDLEFADGDSVTAWPDTSGLDNHLTTHVAGVMEIDGIGGQPSVVFSRGTWYSMPAPVDRPVTVVGVMKSTDSGSLHSILFGNDSADSYPYFGMISGQWRLSDGGATYVGDTVPVPLDPHVMYARASVDGMMSGADGAKATTVATMGFKPQNLGYWWINNGYSMLGQVSEMLVYNEALTDVELDAIVHQLGLIYGITVSV